MAKKLQYVNPRPYIPGRQFDFQAPYAVEQTIFDALNNIDTTKLNATVLPTTGLIGMVPVWNGVAYVPQHYTQADWGVQQNFSASGYATVSGSLTVAGSGHFQGTLTVDGSGMVSGSITVAGSGYIAGNSLVGGNETIRGSQTVLGNTVVSGTFTSAGSGLFGGFLQAASLTTLGNATVSGNLALAGSGFITGRLEPRGDFFHKGALYGVYNVGPVARGTAFSQVYAVSWHTLNAYTSSGQVSAYTGIASGAAGTPYAQVSDLEALREAYETLRASYDNLIQFTNSIVNELRAQGHFG